MSYVNNNKKGAHGLYLYVSFKKGPSRHKQASGALQGGRLGLGWGMWEAVAGGKGRQGPSITPPPWAAVRVMAWRLSPVPKMI